MENESQKLYRTIIELYSPIARRSKRSLNGRSAVHRFDRKKLARELEKVYYVHFNDPESLSTINAFAEHIKRFGMDKRLPQIEEELRIILKQFFRDKEWKKDEIIFENVPETAIVNGKKQPLRETFVDILRNDISKCFKIDRFVGYDFFKRQFTLKELVEWVYLHEKQSLKRGS